LARLRLLSGPFFACVPLACLALACLLLAGCNNFQHKKPDPTKGVVTGIVLCADTGKPARFATVTLTGAPKPGEKNNDENPLPAAETTITDLDGRFRLEAVQPGRYYAFATLEGYLDPALAFDPDKLRSLSVGLEQRRYAIDQWKDHLKEVTVAVHKVSDISLEIEPAAEISGTVTFDDGSPAIGMHFQLLRKTAKGEMISVGLPLMDSWSIRAVSDGHGHFNLTNLTAGEYAVCTLMPSATEDSAPRVCLGNTFRKKESKTVKVQAGETASGVDIEIPLSGLHTVSGTVTALADGHSLNHATLRLLYADDREPARETALLDDGSFSFDYVPEGKYMLQVSGAMDAIQKISESGNGAETASTQTAPDIHYADKEIPLTVLDDMSDVNLAVSPPPASATNSTPAAPPATPPAPQ
jgi:hypothetical protein